MMPFKGFNSVYDASGLMINTQTFQSGATGFVRISEKQSILLLTLPVEIQMYFMNLDLLMPCIIQRQL